MKIERSHFRHLPETSIQTGFPSAATHYSEAAIDLNEVLTNNRDASYFFRVEGNFLEHFQIHTEDILIIDRSVLPKNGQLILVVKNGEFQVKHFDKTEKDPALTLWGVITYVIHKTA